MKNPFKQLGPPIITATPNLGHQYPAHMFNAMVYPIRPFGIRGIIWYQGERNAKDAAQAEHYREQLARLIGYYRASWHTLSGGGTAKDLPFQFTQLPSWHPPQSQPVEGVEATWVVNREAMRLVSGDVPDAGMVVSIDTGDAYALHPKNKKPIGIRHALLALASTYGKDIVGSGPRFRSMEVDGEQLRLRFESAGSGLMTPRSGPPDAFAIAGEDRRWHWAQAEIEDDSVALSAPEVRRPVAARYAWAMNPSQRNLLYNREGLPASPFRTDDWPLFDPAAEPIEVAKPEAPLGYQAVDWMRPEMTQASGRSADLSAAPADGAATGERRPNLILFLIDDQDYESIATYGGKTWTPNLDRMAAEGMKFTRAHVSSTVCTPSRYSWLTGRYAGVSTSKLYDDACGGAGQQGFPSFNVALERDRMNVGHLLRQAGYETGFVGKFHVGSKLDWPEFFQGPAGLKEIPRDAPPGTDTSGLFAHNERVMQRYLEALGFSWAKNIYPENLNSPYAHHNAEWTTAAALEFIEANKDRPFYLHVCSTLLHGPDRSWRKSLDHPRVTGAGEREAPLEIQGMTPRSELLRALAQQGFDPDAGGVAGEAWIDDALGAVLKKVSDLGIESDTLVVFAPDHGSNAKSSLFARDGTRIPMIAWWPGRIPGGLVCNELVQNIDWVPTAYDLAGTKPPAECRVDGRSLVPLFATGTTSDWRDHLYFEMGNARGIATKDWSYNAVRYPVETVSAIRRATPDRLPKLMSYIGRLGIGTRGADRPGFWDADQLYNLNSDPDERVNLATDPSYANRLKEMQLLLAADIRSVGRPFGEFVPGGNAAPPGQIDAQIKQVKQLSVQGKNVTEPDDSRESRKAARKKRKTSP